MNINLVKLTWRYFHFLTKAYFVNYWTLVYSFPNHEKNWYLHQFSVEIMSIHHHQWSDHNKPMLFLQYSGEFCIFDLPFFHPVCVLSNPAYLESFDNRSNIFLVIFHHTSINTAHKYHQIVICSTQNRYWSSAAAPWHLLLTFNIKIYFWT